MHRSLAAPPSNRFVVVFLHALNTESAVTQHEVAGALQVDVRHDTAREVGGVRRNTKQRDDLRAGLAKNRDTIRIQRLNTLGVVKAISNDARVAEILLNTSVSALRTRDSVAIRAVEASCLEERVVVNAAVAVVNCLTIVESRLRHPEDARSVRRLLGREVERANTELDTCKKIVAERPDLTQQKDRLAACGKEWKALSKDEQAAVIEVAKAELGL